MKTALSVSHLAASLCFALNAAFCASAQAGDVADAWTMTQSPGMLLAWQNSATPDANHEPQLAAGARAITPRLDFAGQRFALDAAPHSEASSFFYTYPLTDSAILGLDIGAIGPGFSSGARNVNLAPSLAYSINDRLLLSVGLNAGYFGSAHARHAGQYSNCMALEEAGLLPLYSCSDAIAYTPASLAGSQAGSLEAEGVGYGYNLGATLALGEGTRLGMRYRSGMSLSVEDETVFHTAGPLLSTDLARLTDQAAIAGLGLPESFAVGASHRFNERWSLAGDVTWVNWSQFDDLRIASSGSRSGDITTDDWDSTYRYTLGLNYRHNEQWKYRLGAAYDQSPIPMRQASTALIPAEDLVWVAFGIGYSPTPRISLDVGYAYPFLLDPRLYNGLQHNLAGRFEGEGDILSAQFKWRFE